MLVYTLEIGNINWKKAVFLRPNFEEVVDNKKKRAYFMYSSSHPYLGY